MEDGEIDSKVGVSFMFGVYCLVQVDAEDSVVTITEEAPTKSGDKVSIYISLNYICWFLQEENVFVPSLISVLLSVKLMEVLVRILIRCVDYFCCVLLYVFMCFVVGQCKW